MKGEKPLKAITFLGTNNYESVVYVRDNERCLETKLFPIALTQLEFYGEKISEVFAVVTVAAKEKWFEPLKSGLQSQGVRVTPIDILDGHSENDLWTIFTQITDHLQTGDRVIFDITHSFRTLPFLAFLATAYLRVAKQVEIVGIYYGAYEAKDEFGNAPIFNLTPFVALLDWTTATDKFLSSGDAQGLTQMLDGNAEPIRGFAETIKLVSQARALGRPLDMFPAAESLRLKLPAIETAQRLPKPITTLLGRVKEDCDKYALPLQGSLLNLLRHQRNLILDYIELGQVLQAFTSYSEWMVTLLCHEFREQIREEWRPFWRDRINVRMPLSEALNCLLFKNPKVKPGEVQHFYALLTGLDSIRLESVKNGWELNRNFRNSLAHCGIDSRDKNTVETIIDALDTKLRPSINDLALKFRLDEK